MGFPRFRPLSLPAVLTIFVGILALAQGKPNQDTAAAIWSPDTELEPQHDLDRELLSGEGKTDGIASSQFGVPSGQIVIAPPGTPFEHSRATQKPGIPESADSFEQAIIRAATMVKDSPHPKLVIMLDQHGYTETVYEGPIKKPTYYKGKLYLPRNAQVNSVRRPSNPGVPSSSVAKMIFGIVDSVIHPTAGRPVEIQIIANTCLSGSLIPAFKSRVEQNGQQANYRVGFFAAVDADHVAEANSVTQTQVNLNRLLESASKNCRALGCDLKPGMEDFVRIRKLLGDALLGEGYFQIPPTQGFATGKFDFWSNYLDQNKKLTPSELVAVLQALETTPYLKPAHDGVLRAYDIIRDQLALESDRGIPTLRRALEHGSVQGDKIFHLMLAEPAISAGHLTPAEIQAHVAAANGIQTWGLDERVRELRSLPAKVAAEALQEAKRVVLEEKAADAASLAAVKNYLHSVARRSDRYGRPSSEDNRLFHKLLGYHQADAELMGFAMVEMYVHPSDLLEAAARDGESELAWVKELIRDAYVRGMQGPTPGATREGGYGYSEWGAYLMSQLPPDTPQGRAAQEILARIKATPLSPELSRGFATEAERALRAFTTPGRLAPMGPDDQIRNYLYPDTWMGLRLFGHLGSIDSTRFPGLARLARINWDGLQGRDLPALQGIHQQIAYELSPQYTCLGGQLLNATQPALELGVAPFRVRW